MLLSVKGEKHNTTTDVVGGGGVTNGTPMINYLLIPSKLYPRVTSTGTKFSSEIIQK